MIHALYYFPIGNFFLLLLTFSYIRPVRETFNKASTIFLAKTISCSVIFLREIKNTKYGEFPHRS